jgi:peptidyl-prolyl cis-trans isomerase SurA
MKSSWLAAGLLFVCASASAQAPQQSQQQPPPSQPQSAPPVAPAAAPQSPATSRPKGQTQPGRASSNPVPSSETLQPPESPIKGQVVEELVARVNNEIITTLDYLRARADAATAVKEECKTCTPEQVHTALEQTDKDVLRDLIDTSLMVQRAKDLDISVETDVVREMDGIRQQNNLADMEALQKAVETEGIDWEEFKNNIRKHLLVNEVMRREVASKMTIDKVTMQKYYDEHNDLFQRPEMVYVREIFVSTKDKTEAEIPKLKAKADELRQRVLENGDDFGELAKHFSDGSTAKQGGDLGSFQPGQLNADYAQVFKLNRNEMTPVIQIKDGYVVLQVQERYEAGLQPMEKVESEIEQRITNEKIEPKKRDYCNTLRSDSYVWVHPGYVDSAGVASTPIVEEQTPVADKKSKDEDSDKKKRKKFLKIF